MAIPAIPSGFIVQQGNGQVYLSWSITVAATTYQVQRSTDGVSFTTVASPAATSYLDTAVTIGTQYYYQIASTNGSGTSPYTNAQSIVPTKTGEMSLGQVRLLAQQRSDMVGSQFISVPEWNSYINQSYFELYDLLVTLFEDYYVEHLDTTTDGSATLDLPNGVNYDGAKPFYKLMGIDLGLATDNNAFITMRKFDFIARNRFVYPTVAAAAYSLFNMQYRVLGDKIRFIPTPQSGQSIRLWFIPRMNELLKDSDILDGISGWTEYVITDAAIKAMQKEESDVSVLAAQKMALLKRIEDSAMNRDVGQPDTISDTRGNGMWGRGAGYDGSFGGF